MQTTILATAIASLIAVAPAAAEPRNAPAPVPAAQGETGVAPTAGNKTRYCYRTETTGSRLTKKVCRTRDEWKLEGVTVPANL